MNNNYSPYRRYFRVFAIFLTSLGLLGGSLFVLARQDMTEAQTSQAESQNVSSIIESASTDLNPDLSWAHTNIKSNAALQATNSEFSSIWFDDFQNDTFSVVWGDMDGDGDLDLAVGNYGQQQNQLYENDGKGGFTDITDTTLSSQKDTTRDMAWGDMDGDGDLDLVAGNTGQNRLYENKMNEGQGFITSTLPTKSDTTRSVAWGDMDEDGDLDLIAGNNGQNRLYENKVNEGQGFIDITDSTLPTEIKDTWSVAWGDMDGDGDLDLVAGNNGQNQLYENKVNEGQGFIDITDGILPDISVRTNSVAWGDMDGDGDLDLVVGNGYYRLPNRLYENKVNENQGFTDIMLPESQETNTQSVAWGDMDGDGDLDLVVGNYNQPDQLYENDGDGGFTDITTSTLPYVKSNTFSVAWGDIDGDGDLDLVTGSRTFYGKSGQNRLYRNDGGGNFNDLIKSTLPELPEKDNTRSVAWGDMDGDGDLDLVAGNNGHNRLYRNDGKGGFTNVITSTLSAATDNTLSVAWGDMDGDGDLDLVVGNSGQNRLYRNDGKGDFTLVTTSTLSTATDSTRSVAWGDIDGDGDLDLVVGNSGQNGLYRNDGKGGFTNVITSTLSAATDNTRSVAWGDIDGDGDLDLVVGNHDQKNRLYRNDGGEGFTDITTSSFPPNSGRTYSVAWGDIDGDGDLDLVTGNSGNQNRLYRNDGGGIFSDSTPSMPINGDNTRSVALGDADGDGDLDFIAGNTGQNLLYHNDGTGVFFDITANALPEDNDAAYSVAWGDMDGDGDLDLVVGNLIDGDPNERNYENRIYKNTRQGNGIEILPHNDPYLSVTDPYTSSADYYASNMVLTNPVIPISYTLFETKSVSIGMVKAEFSLNGVGDWQPAVATTDTITTNLSSSPWPTGTTHTYHWDTFASGFFGKSDNVVFRIKAYSQSDITGTYSYPNLSPFPIQRAIASATTFPFRMRGAQVQVFSETIDVENRVPEAVVFRRPEGSSQAEVMANLNSGASFTTNHNGYLTGHGKLNLNDQLMAALPVTTTYRTPPQLLFGGEDGLGQLSLVTPPTTTFTAEFWLRSFRDDGIIVSDGSTFMITNPANLELTLGGITTQTGVAIHDGALHHLALSWQNSDGQWRLYLDGTRIISGNAAINTPLDLNTLTFGEGYNGYMDEIRLWDSVRTADQISATYNSPLWGTQSGLVGYWPIEEDDSSYVKDHSGLGNDMTITGGALLIYKPLYTLYHTSAPITLTTPAVGFFSVITPGVQQLVVSKENPLLLFDLSISLEWDASNDPVFLEQLEIAIQQASATLYDVSNGQMALRNVLVYQNKEHWLTADVVIKASNGIRPSAAIGGLVGTPMDDVDAQIPNAYVPGQIRMGPSWDPFGQTTSDLGQEWWQAFAHELGHYFLFLPDNYLGIDEGLLVTVDCPGSFMTNSYNSNYSEFLINNNVWQESTECQKTIAAKTTGRADWETITQFYPFLIEPTDIISGPGSLPLGVTHIAIDLPEETNDTLPSRIFELRDSTTNQLIKVPNGQGYLFKIQHTTEITNNRLIQLGDVNNTGQFLRVRGAEAGDYLCVLGNGYGGCDSITPIGSTLNIDVTPLGWSPQITVMPINSTTLQIKVTGVTSITGALNTQFLPIYEPLDTDTLSPWIPMTETTTDTYSATIKADFPVFAGFVRVWGNQSREAIVPFTLGKGFNTDEFMFKIDEFVFGGDEFAFGGDEFAFGGDEFAFGGDEFAFGGDEFAFGGDEFAFGGDEFAFGGDEFAFGGDEFAFGANRRAWGAPVSSPNREVTIINRSDVFSKTNIATIQEITTLPDFPSWISPIGSGYRVSEVANSEPLTRAITFQYLSRAVPDGYENPDLMNIYFSDNDGSTWQSLETTIDTDENFAIASLPDSVGGMYVLAVTVPIVPSLQQGWNVFGYPIQSAQGVSLTLASIEGKYTAVANYDPTRPESDWWQTYFDSVEPPFEEYVSTLDTLQFTRLYHIYMLEAGTIFLDPTPLTAHNTAARGSALQSPPAIIYGWITPTATFNPEVGAKVEAWIDGNSCGETRIVDTVGNGGQLAYILQVRADDGNGCGAMAREITFEVNGQQMPNQTRWDNSHACYFSLSNQNENTPNCFGNHTVYLPFVAGNHASSNSAPDLIVSNIAVDNNDIEITLFNQGTEPVTADMPFWVELYINPIRIPTVNDTWPMVADVGAVWGVTSGALPLAPRKSLMLTLTDAYYHDTLSNFSAFPETETFIFVQVDSAHTGTNYGAILENHEITGGVYNNIEVVVYKPE